MNQSALPVKIFFTPKEAAKKYARDYASDSHCVDISGQFPVLLHARSNRTVSAQSINIGFAAYARRNNIRVITDNYPGFLQNLSSRVMSELPHVLGTSFRPVNQPFFVDHAGVQLANTFVPYKPEPIEPPPILTEYFERLFCNDDDRKHVLRFLADIIQNPMRRPQHGLLITGEQGNGKSTILQLVHKALGNRHTWTDNSYTTAFKDFSEVLPNNLFVVFDDAISNKNTHQRLKLEITRSYQSVNIKHQQRTIDREVKTRIAVISNSRRPLILDNCRRFYATEFSSHLNSHNPEGLKTNTDAFFKLFIAWLETAESAAQIYTYFMRVDLSDFNPASIPQTQTLLDMIDMGNSVLDKAIEAYIEDRPFFHAIQIYEHLKSIQVPYAPDLISKKLIESDYQNKRRKLPGYGNHMPFVWSPNPPIGKIRSRTITEIEAADIALVIGLTF